MPFDQLSEFLAALQNGGDLVRIKAEVDPVCELTEISEQLGRSHPDGGPVLFFENVRGSRLPVAANLLGSPRRICQALGVESFDAAAQRLAALLAPDVPDGWRDSLRLIPRFTQLAASPPRAVKAGPCQQVVKLGKDVDLGELPIPQFWPGETARTLTAGQVYLRTLETGTRKIERYPLEVRGRDELLLHWTPHHDGRRLFDRWRAAGQQMPLAVVLGGDPLLTYAAGAPLPSHTDGLLLAGLLRGRGVDVVRGRTVELEVPAHAEFVIEGYIDPHEAPAAAGTVAAPTGFLAPHDTLPVMHVTAMTHRANPVLPVIIPAGPPSEEHWLAKLTERLLVPIVRLVVPEVCDLHMPWAAASRNLLFVSIHKDFPRQARKVMNALWSLRPLMTIKTIVVVDADVDVRDEHQVWHAVGANIHPERDVTLTDGPGDMDDHAAPFRCVGSKLGIDATAKTEHEGHPRAWPARLAMPDDLRRQVAARWEEFGLPEARPTVLLTPPAEAAGARPMNAESAAAGTGEVRRERFAAP